MPLSNYKLYIFIRVTFLLLLLLRREEHQKVILYSSSTSNFYSYNNQGNYTSSSYSYNNQGNYTNTLNPNYITGFAEGMFFFYL